MKKWVYYFVSFILPVRLKVYQSDYSGILNLWMINGKKMLDTKNANYSFGSLHRVFQKVFKLTNLSQFEIKNALLLGLGAGSIVKIINDELNIHVPIEAVEIDPVLIQISKEEFFTDKFAHLTIIQEDAFDFLMHNTNTYSLVIIDLFIDAQVPEKFTSESFINVAKRSVEPGGRLYFNFIVNGDEDQKRIDNIHKFLGSNCVIMSIDEFNKILVWNQSI